MHNSFRELPKERTHFGCESEIRINVVNLIKRMFARPRRWAAFGRVSANKENDRNWRLFEAVLIPLPSTPLQALLCSGSFSPLGFIAGPDENYTCGHYLPEWSWGIREPWVSERVCYSGHKFDFYVLTTLVCAQHQRVCLSQPFEMVFRTLTSMKSNEFSYATSIRKNTLLTPPNWIAVLHSRHPPHKK